MDENTKHTAAGIPTWSPTVVLICRSTAYVWQSGRDAQFSADCGRMCSVYKSVVIYFSSISMLHHRYVQGTRSHVDCLEETGFDRL
jgi:hypothetical protein